MSIVAKGLEFPCNYPIKVMGPNTDEFESVVIEIVSTHQDRMFPELIRRKNSSNGKYRSITIPVDVNTREDLEEIYRSLSENDMVLWTL